MTEQPAQLHRPRAGLAFNGLSYLAISVNDALGKLAVAFIPIAQLLTIRSVCAILILLPLALALARNGANVFGTRRLWLHLCRALVMVVSTITFFHALRDIELAKITAIMFATPILVAVMSPVAIGERVEAHQWVAVALGFAGTLIVLETGFGRVGWAEALALFSAVTWAMSMLMLRSLAATEPPITVIAWFNLIVLPIYAVLAIGEWQPIDLRAVALVASLAALNTAGQWLGAIAFKLARAATVAPMQYSQLLWASMFSWLLWGNVPTWTVLLGASLIVAAGLILLFAPRGRASD